jgi:cell division protein FtsA
LVESKKFIEIVEARVEEIVENAWFQIPVEFSDKLLGGIILTGGGSNMPEIDKVFKTHTHIDKVRIAKFVSQTVNSKDPKITNHDGTMNTVLGLLAKGDMNCAVEIVLAILIRHYRVVDKRSIYHNRFLRSILCHHLATTFYNRSSNEHCCSQ